MNNFADLNNFLQFRDLKSLASVLSQFQGEISAARLFLDLFFCC